MIARVPLLLSLRFCITVICTLSLSMMIVQRLNISYTKSCMLSISTNNFSNDSEAIGTLSGTLDWSEEDINHLASANLYAYALSQIPAAVVVQLIGPYFTGMIAHGLLSCIPFLFPVIANFNFHLAMFAHILIGINSSLILCATLRIMSRWVVKTEKGILFGIFGTGSFIGIMLTIPISVETCMLGSLTSWHSVFYITGGCSSLLLLLWLLIVRTHPLSHPCTSKEEKAFLKENQVVLKEPESIPWLSILRNKHCIGFFVAHACVECATYNLVYFAGELLRERSSGYRSLREIQYPFITYWAALVACTPCYGMLFDFIQKHQYLSKINSRRLFVGIGTLIPGAMAIIFASINKTVVTETFIVFIVWFCALGANYGAGMFVSFVDMMPLFPDSFSSISNTLANLAVPTANFLDNYLKTSKSRRIIMMYVSAGCYFCAFVLFCLFATGEQIKFTDNNIQRPIQIVSLAGDKETRLTKEEDSI